MSILKNKALVPVLFFAVVLVHIVALNAVFAGFNRIRMQDTHQTIFVMKGLAAAAAKPAVQKVTAPPKKKRSAPKKVPPKPQPEQIITEQKPEPIPQDTAVLPVSTIEETQPAEIEETAADTENKNTATEDTVSETGLGEASVLEDIQAVIIQQIMRKKIYPKAARKRNQEGFVTLHIIVDRSGKLIKVEITEACPYPFLNQAAVATVKAAAPFKIKQMNAEEITVRFTLQYRLENRS